MMNKEAAAFLEAVKKYQSILIYIPGSPDPDALASSFAIRLILGYLGINAEIYAEKNVSLPQNQVFISKLKIPANFGKAINGNLYEAYIVLDFQSNRIDGLSERIPCVAHIDHHAKAVKETVKADFSLIRGDVGSTSTLVALLIKNFDLIINENDLKALATALIFGIQTDTDKYNYLTALDLEALNYLTEFADQAVLQSISSIPLSPVTLLYFNKAKENQVIYKDWAFYGLGYIESRYRDSIAITADLLLKQSEHNVVAVYAVIENHRKRETYLDVSLRSSSSTVDLNRVIKKITPNGGGRRYKGAYQVKLNYLQNTPDRELLWQVVETATLESLRRSRDTLYITGLESAYNSVKSKLRTLLQKEKPGQSKGR